MADVAHAAGVSVTTVSHVVNRTRPVNPETEKAVLSAIADSGYIPDTLARSLRTGGTQTVGLALTALTNPYFADVVHGIDRAASQAGYSLLLADTHDEVATELRAVSDLLRRRVDGIILAASADPSGALQHAHRRGVPMVLIDRLIRADVDQVGVENIKATAKLVDHLAELGHHRIAMVSGHPGLSTTEERLQGFRLGLRRNGLSSDPDYVQPGDPDGEMTHAAVHKLLALERPPTALVVGNNQMTIRVMRELRNAGLRVPDDIALVAFDDFEWADLFHPRLTVIAQPTKAIGERAFKLLMSRLADPSKPVRRIRMQPTFIHRESCGCPVS